MSYKQRPFALTDGGTGATTAAGAAAMFGIPFLNVMSYGATGNGTTDDTSAITSALAAASSSLGNIIYFPPGKYLISSQIVISKPLTLMGAGVGTSIIIQSAPASGCFYVDSNYVTIEDLAFQSPIATTSGSGQTLSGTGITVTVNSTAGFPSSGTVLIQINTGLWTSMAYTSTTSTTFVGCTGSGTYSSGAYVQCSTGGYAIDCGAYGVSNYFSMFGCQISNFYNGVWLYGTYANISFTAFINTSNNSIYTTYATGNYSVIGCNFITSTGTGANAHIYLNACNYCLIENCTIQKGGNAAGAAVNQGGIVIAPTSSSQTVAGVYVNNCSIDNNNPGVYIGGSGFSATKIKFANCSFYANASYALYLNNTLASGLEIESCDFFNNGSSGFIYDAACLEYSITECRFAGANNGGYALISSPSPTTKSIRFMNNFVGPVCGFGLNSTGVQLSSGTYGTIIIQNNIITGNTANFTDSSTAWTTKITGPNAGLIPALGALISNTSNVAVNTTTETEVCDFLIPANALQVGTTFRITAWGQCVSTGTTAGAVHLRFGTANTASDALVLSIPQTPTSATSQFRIEYIFTVRSLGSSGTVLAQALLLNSAATGFANVVQTIPASTGAITVNTTVANYLSLWMLLGAATVVTTFYNATIEVIKP